MLKGRLLVLRLWHLNNCFPLFYKINLNSKTHSFSARVIDHQFCANTLLSTYIIRTKFKKLRIMYWSWSLKVADSAARNLKRGFKLMLSARSLIGHFPLGFYLIGRERHLVSIDLKTFFSWGVFCHFEIISWSLSW